MTDSIQRALGFDKVNLDGKLIVIDEFHGSDGNFLINSVISKSLDESRAVCLVLFHNTFGHYHNILMKLGYNLKNLLESGIVLLLEPMKSIVYNIDDLGHDSVDADEVENELQRVLNMTEIPNPTRLDSNLIKHLFESLKNQYDEAKRNCNEVTLIIDDISHLIDLNLSFAEIWSYVKYIKSLMDTDPLLSICILGHSYQTGTENCDADLIVTFGLRRMSHLYITIRSLETGHANDVSGIITVVWRLASLREQYHLNERTSYLFKLLDRQVKLFTPGSMVEIL